MEEIHNQQFGGAQQTKNRDSNIELFRIISMLLIIAHHYVVNSGLTVEGGVIYSDPISWRSLFLLCFGSFGKIGINCFVFITGYYMCESDISLRKFCKLLFEILFYNIIIYIIFLAFGYSRITLEELFYVFIPVTAIKQNFTDTFLVFFLFIPFLNKLVHSINERQHIRLLCISCFTYVFVSTVLFDGVTMNYVSWYMVLFVIASYIRRYPKALYSNTKFWGIMSLCSVAVSLASVILSTWIGAMSGYNSSYVSFYYVVDSNKFYAVLTGLSLFMFFKNLKIKYIPLINSVASTTFGVLCIHANSDAMRQWLWQDVLDNVGMYSSQWMPVHAILSVFGVFIICSGLDFLRIKFIEKPFFKLYDKSEKKIIEKYKCIEDKIFIKFHIN